MPLTSTAKPISLVFRVLILGIGVLAVDLYYAPRACCRVFRFFSFSKSIHIGALYTWRSHLILEPQMIGRTHPVPTTLNKS